MFYDYRLCEEEGRGYWGFVRLVKRDIDLDFCLRVGLGGYLRKVGEGEGMSVWIEMECTGGLY